MRRFLRTLKTELPYDPAIPLLGLYVNKTIIQKDIYAPIFIAALLIIAKRWKQFKCPLAGEWIKTWHVYTMEYYSAIKENEIILFAATWMYLEIIILIEVNHEEKYKNHMMSLRCAI